MITPKRVFVISMAVFGAYCVARANAANSPGALSQYGQIQAVKNYSSNPYWNPNSPYNQKAIPKAIYVTGADLTTEDCNTIVGNLVASFCATNNNCSNMRLADVRPTIMVQLSQLPGHNYATACGGYIDAAFDKYAQTSITITAPQTTNTNTSTYTFQNPYAPKLNAYQAGVLERTKELEQLQAQTAASAQIESTDFPKTVADLSLTDRMANATAGYEPYKNKSAYKIPNFETEEDFNKRLKTQNLDEYCTRFPNDADCKCVLNPEDPECKESIQKDRTNNNSTKFDPLAKCSDPQHMRLDEKGNCICFGQSAKLDAKTRKCYCENGESIDFQCNKKKTPQCLINLGLPNGTIKFDSADSIVNDSDACKYVAQSVIVNCLLYENKEETAEFNAMLDAVIDDNSQHSIADQTVTLPILFQGDKQIEFTYSQLSKLFGCYYFPTTPIVIKDPELPLLSHITAKEVNAETDNGSTFANCIGIDVRGRTKNEPDWPMSKIASTVYGNSDLGFYNLASYRVYDSDHYEPYMFPGQPLAYKSGTARYYTRVVKTLQLNYIVARRLFKQFIEKVKSAAPCQIPSATAYLVSPGPNKSYKALIVSDPYPLQTR